MTSGTPDFLGVGDVLELLAPQIARYGGADGLRDRGLLESALAQPRATFAGERLHEDLFFMAAAYLFHIVRNDPFVDGNKRTGLIAPLVFLDLNGISIEHGSPDLCDLTLRIALGVVTKDAAAEALRQIARIH